MRVTKSLEVQTFERYNSVEHYHAPCEGCQEFNLEQTHQVERHHGQSVCRQAQPLLSRDYALAISNSLEVCQPFLEQ